MNAKTSKRMPGQSTKARVREDAAREYRLDYTKAKPNRFADRAKAGSLTITLDPDVAEVFTTAESVNTILRALIAAMPKPTT
jgi:hypothetical protein